MFKHNYQAFVKRKQQQYSNFDSSDLAKQFIYAFDLGDRIEVEFCSKEGKPYETKRGTVGVTTGWKPCFILMLTRRSTGSSYTLNKNDRITRIIKKGAGKLCLTTVILVIV